MAFEECDHAFKDLLCVLTFPCSTGSHQLTGLPDIMMIVFDYGDIEFLMQARNDGLDVTPFGFKGVAVRDVNGQG